MANVGFEDISAADVATMLGVQRCTVTYWCRNGYIKFQDVSEAGSKRPRYMFTYDEVERVSKLIEKYGLKAWCHHANEGLDVVPVKGKELCPAKITVFNNAPENKTTETDDTEEIAGYIGKIRQLKKQREKLLEEIDALDNAIKSMRAKVIEAI